MGVFRDPSNVFQGSGSMVIGRHRGSQIICFPQKFTVEPITATRQRFSPTIALFRRKFCSFETIGYIFTNTSGKVNVFFYRGYHLNNKVIKLNRERQHSYKNIKNVEQLIVKTSAMLVLNFSKPHAVLFSFTTFRTFQQHSSTS